MLQRKPEDRSEVPAEIIYVRPKNHVHPVEDVYCHLGNKRIHYQVSGPHDAKPLVLLHGVGGCVNWWRENMPVLSQHYRTYALDLPGFGRSARLAGSFTIDSAAEFVLDWMKLLHLERVHMLAHSMGGHIAARIAAQHHHLIDRLVLVAPSGLWLSLQERLRWLRDIPKVRVPLSQTLTIATGTMRTDLIALGQSLKAVLSDRKAAESLQLLKAPTLLLWGSADGIVPPALAPLTLTHIKNAPARLEVVERGTHNLMYDQASAFNKLVLDFLREEV